MLQPHNDRPSQLTKDEARAFWRAGKAHALEETFWRIATILFGFQLLVGAGQGRPLLAVLIIGGECVCLVLLREAWSCMRQRIGRTWRQWLREYARRQREKRGHGGRTLVVLLVLGGMLAGCQDYVRTVAHLYGYKGDPYANPCAPESLSVGHCVPTNHDSAQPEGVKR
jgi:hypothetical protein